MAVSNVWKSDHLLLCIHIVQLEVEPLCSWLSFVSGLPRFNKASYGYLNELLTLHFWKHLGLKSSS